MPIRVLRTPLLQHTAHGVSAARVTWQFIEFSNVDRGLYFFFFFFEIYIKRLLPKSFDVAKTIKYIRSIYSSVRGTRVLFSTTKPFYGNRLNRVGIITASNIVWMIFRTWRVRARRTVVSARNWNSWKTYINKYVYCRFGVFFIALVLASLVV